MMYDLVQTRRGKETVVMTGTLPKINDRMRQLRSCQRKGIRGDKTTYAVRKSAATEKFRAKPHNLWGPR